MIRCAYTILACFLAEPAYLKTFPRDDAVAAPYTATRRCFSAAALSCKRPRSLFSMMPVAEQPEAKMALPVGHLHVDVELTRAGAISIAVLPATGRASTGEAGATRLHDTHTRQLRHEMKEAITSATSIGIGRFTCAKNFDTSLLRHTTILSAYIYISVITMPGISPPPYQPARAGRASASRRHRVAKSHIHAVLSSPYARPPKRRHLPPARTPPRG